MGGGAPTVLADQLNLYLNQRGQIIPSMYITKCPTRFSDLPTALKQASHSHLENDFVSSFIATIELWPCKHFGVSLTSDLFFLIFDSRENMARALLARLKLSWLSIFHFFLKFWSTNQVILQMIVTVFF